MRGNERKMRWKLEEYGLGEIEKINREVKGRKKDYLPSMFPPPKSNHSFLSFVFCFVDCFVL